MDRYWQADAVESTPDLTTLTSEGYPTNGNASTGVAPTKPGAAWYYMITEELRNLITNAGLTPDHTDLTQLVQALKTWQNFPTGTVMPWVSKTTIPDNWLIMNGQSLLKTDYADLNAFINSDGSLDNSDDSTYFDLPDMSGRVWQGCSSYADVLTPLEAGLPNIQGHVGFSTHLPSTSNNFMESATGAFSTSNYTVYPKLTSYTDVTGSTPRNLYLDASTYNGIYSDDTATVQPPSYQALMIIRA